MEKAVYIYIWEWDLSICVSSINIEEVPAVYIMAEETNQAASELLN